MLIFRELKEPFFVAEIGINHNGDLQIAKRLIDAASACGWDCVKFQKRDPDTCVPEEQKKVIKDTLWGKMSYLEYRKRLEFGKPEYDFINKYCTEKPIHWTASVWDLASLDFIVKYNPIFIKIPSAQMTNYTLVKAAAKTQLPLVISTGMSTLKEVDNCVEILSEYNQNFVLMHANSAYPSPVEEINLNIIKMFLKRYKHPVIGYSGHEYGLEPSVIAVALGAKVIERHITLDHAMWGTDQKASLEIEGMQKLIRRARLMQKLLGTRKKKVTNSEIEIRKKLKGN